MRLTEHFTAAELTDSDLAQRRGLANVPGPDALANLKRLAGILETVRVVLGGPMVITSGYRSAAINQLVGGAPSSAHVDGRAADFKCPSFGAPLDICREIVRAGVPFDQLIEEGTWVHLAIPRVGDAWRKEILRARFGVGGKVMYSRGLE